MKYGILTMYNAFGAPVYHIGETASTMEDAKLLAEAGAVDGTVIQADYQSAGRGRVDGRTWEAKAGNNLLCTVILRRPPVNGFTLRVGLAAALAFDAFLPADCTTRIKWPNDVLFRGRKLAGILCENSGPFLYVGTGLNIAQTDFPPEIEKKAASLESVLRELRAEGNLDVRAGPDTGKILAVYLEKLKQVLGMENWNEAVTEKLYRRGEKIRFLGGDPGKNQIVEGYLEGIGVAGELLVRPEGRAGTVGDGLLHLYSGEIPY